MVAKKKATPKKAVQVTAEPPKAEEQGRQITQEEREKLNKMLHPFGEETEEQKAQSELFSREIEQKRKEILGQHLFIVTEEIADQIWNSTYKYPDYNSPEVKELLFRMAITKDAEFGKAKYEDDDWKIELGLWFFTSPKQFKILFQDRFSDYPFLFLFADIGRKYFFREGDKEKSVQSTISQQPISLGRAVSLMKQFKFEWL